jgi:transcription termination/antitermination protein NusA
MMKINIHELITVAQQLNLELSTFERTVKESVLLAYLRHRHLIEQFEKPELSIPYRTPKETIDVKLDIETGDVEIRRIYMNDQGEQVNESDTPDGFDRVMTAAARSVALAGFRQLRDISTFAELESRIGSMVSGVIQQGLDKNVVQVDLGPIEAQLPPAEQVPGESYEHGKRIKVFLVTIRQMSNGLHAIVSRTHPGLVRELFKLEVPEIAKGVVEIKEVAREAGARTKIAVLSNDTAVAAKGSCIGPMGSRVSNVVSELGEKIDIVDYSEDPDVFVGNALSPARVIRVDVLDLHGKVARAFVPDYQLSLAIGKDGQNARLAARLTGWKIDIRPDTDPLFQETVTTLSEEG